MDKVKTKGNLLSFSDYNKNMEKLTDFHFQEKLCWPLWYMLLPMNIWIFVSSIVSNFLIFENFIEVYLIYNVVLIFTVQDSDSITHTHTYIIFHYGFSQNIAYNSLCYPVGPYCLSSKQLFKCVTLLKIA